MEKKVEKLGKWDTHTVEAGIWWENWQKREIETYTVGPGIWKEIWQKRKMRNSHGRTWNMTRNTEKREKNEKCTL